MTVNNSSTAGFLLPDSEIEFVGSGVITFVGNGPIIWVNSIPYQVPLEDQALDDFFQILVSGITGLPGTNIRPRYQETEVPNIPDYGTDWAAIGVMNIDSDDYPYVQHYDDISYTSGTFAFDQMIRHENIEVLVSFYGPNAGNNCSILRDGLYIPQNFEYLTLAGMGLTAAGPHMQKVPQQIKTKWWNRYDIYLYIKRAIQRRYAIFSLLSAAAQLWSNISNDLDIGQTPGLLINDIEETLP